MRALALAALLLWPAPHGDDPSSRTFAVRCGKLYVGNDTVLEDATMLVVDGRITAVGAAANAPAVPQGTPVLDALDRVVMPGLVLADTDLGGHQDASHNVTPDFVATEGFDFAAARARFLSGGVTTVYLSPGRYRLISGQGSVVKLFGDDLVQRVLDEQACLRINMGSQAAQAPALYKPTAAPTSDDPLLPARRQLPSARISMLTELRRLFREADGEATARLAGTGSGEDRYHQGPLQEAARGELPLRIATARAADAQRALQLARELHARLVLENPPEIGAIAEAAAQQGASAVFRLPVRPGASNPGGEDRKSSEPRPQPDDPARAAASGMRIALAPTDDDDLPDALLVAGIAVRHGLAPRAALRAITGDAAAILGVDERVGTLEPGKDADFLVLSGEPFAIGTMVEKTFVDGVLAFERKASGDVLAVRAGKVMTMAGRTLRDGMVIVQDGTIRAVGEDLAIPYGARLIEVPGGTIVPGFIDAYSHLGLSGSGAGIPKGSADQCIAEAVAPNDPLFRGAVEAGLTTVLVAGVDGDPVSGRVAALKTAARDRASMVLKAMAAQRFVYDAIEPDGIKPLADALDRARKYIEKWEQYRKAQQEIAEGKAKPKPEPTPAPEPAQVDPLSGTWELEFEDGPPFPMVITLELKLEGTAVTGELTLEIRGRKLPPVELREARLQDKKLTFLLQAPMMGESKGSADIGEDSMEGTLAGEQQTVHFSGKRVRKPGGAPVAADPSAGPHEPEIDEALEPLRAVIEHRIPAVIRSDRAPAIERVLEWLEENKLAYVLTGLRDAVETPEILGASHAPVVLGPDVVQREGGQTINAAAVFADRGHPIAFGTGATAGARFLPLHAAMAVRYGMDPARALEALTIEPARMFKLDDRVGSLERGKDADFVVFSGNPFEMTSRVILVVVNGAVVVDHREASR